MTNLPATGAALVLFRPRAEHLSGRAVGTQLVSRPIGTAATRHGIRLYWSPPFAGGPNFLPSGDVKVPLAKHIRHLFNGQM
jgi:hypothetical protein